ncbi:hypothetical protein Moror_17407 [Moniliophthora roreri MCA 2997]|uniref:DUF6533 domain-containing protein n=1 Tax=Moniliophthora roreri (strain MCA 2997) TaxID=1381753 RepID=V2XYX7_MONRO|nr:hypothetical protein Moror_17407 [Moniliophthora roreri MCA 2997]
MFYVRPPFVPAMTIMTSVSIDFKRSRVVDYKIKSHATGYSWLLDFPALSGLERYSRRLLEQELPQALGNVFGHETAAVAALVAYDYIITLPDEIELVWSARWNLTKVLYLLQRYMPFVDTVALVLHNDFTPGLGYQQCRNTYDISGWMFVIGIALSEVLLTLRLWAVWHKDYRLTIGLPIFFAVCWGIIFTVMAIWLPSMTFGPQPLPHLGCYVSGGSSILFIAWVLVMLYDGGTMSLMVISGIASYRSGVHRGLVKTIHRDGVFYYIVLFCFALANVVTTVVLPGELQAIVSSAERVMHPILTSRVIHSIRAKASRPSAWIGFDEQNWNDVGLGVNDIP